MAYIQEKRSIEIVTSLEPDKLLLKSCTITEQLGRPFVIKAELLSEDEAIDFSKIIGMAVAIRWWMPDPSGGFKSRYFSGYVSKFVQRPFADDFNSYEATIVPWLWFLTRTADCRIFHASMSEPPDDMTIPGIIKKVFKDHGFDDVTSALTDSYRTMDHCVQYRETDYNFVSRLMEQEGIYYFFDHVKEGEDVKHKLKLVDAMSAHAEYPSYGTFQYRGSMAEEDETGGILSWSRLKQIQPGTYKVTDFDFKNPKTPPGGSGTTRRTHANSEFEIYDFAANFADEETKQLGDRYGKIRVEELQAQYDIIVGAADSPGLACGCTFELDGHPRNDENAKYLIVGAKYQCTAEAYKGAQGQTQSGKKAFHSTFLRSPRTLFFVPRGSPQNLTSRDRKRPLLLAKPVKRF